MEYYAVTYSDDYIKHFGVKGMKWGVRRYQNPDGSLTEAGKRKYYLDETGKRHKKGQYSKAAYKYEEKAKKHAGKLSGDVYDLVGKNYRRVDDFLAKRGEKMYNKGLSKKKLGAATAIGIGLALTPRILGAVDTNLFLAGKKQIPVKTFSKLAAVTTGASIVGQIIGYQTAYSTEAMRSYYERSGKAHR